MPPGTQGQERLPSAYEDGPLEQFGGRKGPPFVGSVAGRQPRPAAIALPGWHGLAEDPFLPTPLLLQVPAPCWRTFVPWTATSPCPARAAAPSSGPAPRARRPSPWSAPTVRRWGSPAPRWTTAHEQHGTLFHANVQCSLAAADLVSTTAARRGKKGKGIEAEWLRHMASSCLRPPLRRHCLQLRDPGVRLPRQHCRLPLHPGPGEGGGTCLKRSIEEDQAAATAPRSAPACPPR